MTSENCGVIIFKRGEIPCPGCLREAPGYQVNPFFEACFKECGPDNPPECGTREYCDACRKSGELVECETCKGTGRVPA